MTYSPPYRILDSPEDVAMQDKIRKRACESLVILGKSFIYSGSGKYVNFLSEEMIKERRLARRLEHSRRKSVESKV